MNKTICVVVPHPDDETLGCGGTILKLQAVGYKIVLIFVTDIVPFVTNSGRENLVDNVSVFYRAESINLRLKPASLDYNSFEQLIPSLKKAFDKFKPEMVLLPYPHDAHSDHYFCYKAAISCLKVFRSPYVNKVMAYETLSETNFSHGASGQHFFPNHYVDVTATFQKKLEATKFYEGEFLAHPFPRSIEAIKALALLRGSESGFEKAESFMIIYSRMI